MNRRTLLFLPIAAYAQSGPTRYIDTHVHLFSADESRFPFAPGAPYKPAALPVEDYIQFARTAGVEHAVIVHPEPYQDDHRYLEYCFAKERTPGFFKATCLFDPIRPDTPARIKQLMSRNPGRIVALRIHEVREPGSPALQSGPIKERNLESPQMRSTWRAVSELGLRMQVHFLPYFAPPIGKLASEFPAMPVILDHLGRGWQGTEEDFRSVLALAKQRQVYIKYAEIPSVAMKSLVRRAFDSFGPDRMIWGDLGHNPAGFKKQLDLFNEIFEFATEDDRQKIRYGTAKKLFFS